jgi:hypothetical protein
MDGEDERGARRRWVRPAALVAGGLLAGGVLAGTVTANAQETTSGSTGSYSTSAPDAPADRGTVDCPDGPPEQGGDATTGA